MNFLPHSFFVKIQLFEILTFLFHLIFLSYNKKKLKNIQTQKFPQVQPICDLMFDNEYCFLCVCVLYPSNERYLCIVICIE